MRQRGFTYVGLLLLVAMSSAALAAAGTLWSLESRRDKEAELLFVGAQFTQAITSFRERTPAGQMQRFPRDLEELVEDKRWPTPRRHLRRIYVDPMTGLREWGLIAAPGGGVQGVHSLSPDAPLKRANFAPEHEEFAVATSYREWRFVPQTPGAGQPEQN
ncbi:type II secretion system protein [Ramlibacter sp. USB13]|uniref:Type II secretion system protein n=1 Tax=Ramlibacter cellulosilyticus TaxID=2764187 RepID=A0A923SCN5_9BURK|nr:type II secretion system protein [Ramlibacter cellulosilyticus]MBC5784453.1 type II secretion system protein [Ramlibacter cellulosilyticus]